MSNIICIAGPTASGKSALAVELAKEYHGEVVSCDSMQVYRRMDIGTAKPTREEMQGIPHHMIDVAEPDEDFSVSRYCRLAAPIVDEAITLQKGVCMALILAGTLLMITRRPGEAKTTDSRAWLWYAVGSAVFAALTSILTKIGITGVDSTLGTAIRTGVVLVMAWGMVFVTRSGSVTRKIRAIDGRSWLFLILSGLCTGGSWLCQNRSLQLIDASLATPIDKLSILITIAFSWLVFG